MLPPVVLSEYACFFERQAFIFDFRLDPDVSDLPTEDAGRRSSRHARSFVDALFSTLTPGNMFTTRTRFSPRKFLNSTVLPPFVIVALIGKWAYTLGASEGSALRRLRPSLGRLRPTYAVSTRAGGASTKSVLVSAHFGRACQKLAVLLTASAKLPTVSTRVGDASARS